MPDRWGGFFLLLTAKCVKHSRTALSVFAHFRATPLGSHYGDKEVTARQM